MAGRGAWRREAVQARCDEIGIRLQGVILKLLAKASIKLVLAPCTPGPRTPDPGPWTQTLDPLDPQAGSLYKTPRGTFFIFHSAVESNLESGIVCELPELNLRDRTEVFTCNLITYRNRHLIVFECAQCRQYRIWH